MISDEKLSFSFSEIELKYNGYAATICRRDRQNSILRQSLRKRFEGKFFLWKTYFFSFSDIERKFFGLLSNSFCQRCQNRFFSSESKRFFGWNSFFYRFWPFNEKLTVCGRFFSGNIVKTAFYESIATFWAKLINWKEIFFFFIFGNCSHFFRPPGKSYRRCDLNSFLRRRPKYRIVGQFFFNKTIFLNDFGPCVKSFRFACRDYPWVFKNCLLFTIGAKRKNKVASKKCLSFSHIDVKFFGLVAKCFHRRCRNWILVVHLNFGKNVFLMKNVLSSNFRQWIKKTASQQEVSAGIVNTPFSDNFQKKDLRESFFFEKPFS